MRGEDVERVLGDDGPSDMFLAGLVLYFEIPFLSAEEFAQASPERRGVIKKDLRDEMREVEASSWMLNHHKPSVLLDQLDLMLKEEREESAS